MNQKWSQKEEDLLKKLYSSHNARELCKIFVNKSYYQIKNKAQRLGLRKQRNINKDIKPQPKWSQKDIDFVIEQTKLGKSAKNIGKILNRTEASIRKIRRLNNIYSKNHWTKEELDIIKKHYATCDMEELSKLIPNKTISQICSCSTRLRLTKTPKFKDGELEQIITQRWNDTIPRKKLAQEIGIGLGTLYNYANKLKLNIDSRFSTNAKAKRWTKQEVRYIEKNYTDFTIEQMSQYLGRSFMAVIQKLHEIGLEKQQKWTEEEIQVLIDNKNLHNEEIAQLIDRSPNAIKFKFRDLNIKRYRRQWTKKELQQVLEYIEDGLTTEEVAKLMNRKNISIKFIRRKLGITQDNLWTSVELNLLKAKHYNMPVEDISRLLTNRSQRSIIKQMDNLGLSYNIYRWSVQEIDLLIKYYPYSTFKELKPLFPDKTYYQIKHKSLSLGLRKTKKVLKEIRDNLTYDFKYSESWRYCVLKRDGFSCQMCGMIDKTGRFLHAHHIKPSRDCTPTERYDENNGICLCVKCHKLTYKNEYKYYNELREKLEAS